MPKVIQANRAIWTPWADVLCAYCHNLTDQARVRRKAISDVVVSASADRTYKCDSCDRMLWVDDDELRDLLALRKRLRDHEGPSKLECSMDQTGGMCMALSGTFETSIAGRKRTIVATCMDCDEGHYCIGVYEGEDWMGGQSPVEEAYCVSLDAAFLYWLGEVAQGEDHNG